ncbi:hypothetical protein GC176_10655 [bacterium]|nr:hypothetical protein [bacterium]
MKENWIKMYDKFGCVLRVETVISNPREFNIRRHGKRRGEIVPGWFPMAKGVANMPRYREVTLAANRRYLDALLGHRDTAVAKKSRQVPGRTCCGGSAGLPQGVRSWVWTASGGREGSPSVRLCRGISRQAGQADRREPLL